MSKGLQQLLINRPYCCVNQFNSFEHVLLLKVVKSAMQSKHEGIKFLREVWKAVIELFANSQQLHSSNANEPTTITSLYGIQKLR